MNRKVIIKNLRNEKSDIKYRRMFTFPFLRVDHIKQTLFWKAKNISQLLYLTFSNCKAS